MTALKSFDKVTFLGFIFGNIEFSYISLMIESLQTQGNRVWLRISGKISRNDGKENLKMDSSAGIKIIGKYGLDKTNKAM